MMLSRPFSALASLLLLGTLAFMPLACIGGTDSVNYNGGNNNGSTSGSGTAESPAVDDDAIVMSGGFVDIKVLNNDHGFETGALVLGDVIRPPWGTVSWDPQDSTMPIRYWPDRGFVGTDSFTYALQNADGSLSNYATVFVTVTPLRFEYTDLDALWIARDGSLPSGGIPDFALEFGPIPETNQFGTIGIRFDEGPEMASPDWEVWDFSDTGDLSVDLGWWYSGGAETKLKLSGTMSEDKQVIYCDYTIMYLGGPMPGGESGTVILERFTWPDSLLAGVWAGRLWDEKAAIWTNLLLDYSEYGEEAILNEYINSGVRYTPQSGVLFSWEIDEEGGIEFVMDWTDASGMVTGQTIFHMQIDGSLARMEGWYERVVEYSDGAGTVWSSTSSTGSVEFERGTGHDQEDWIGVWEGYIMTNTGNAPVQFEFQKWYGHGGVPEAHFTWGQIFWDDWWNDPEAIDMFYFDFDQGPKGDAGLVTGTFDMDDSQDIQFTGLMSNDGKTVSANVIEADGSRVGLMHLERIWTPSN